ncbi:hypothetical protein [Haploplasma modicum]|uniref:hypothetical protein n=1 Tax=Haploplasma modicum TaxID=2150 RepID=UPI00138AB7CF|nr:hypothetical protein [Haploplasma modicum]
MKKILIMFLLSFPLLIFAIVTFSSTVIGYYIPLAVSSVSFDLNKENENISSLNYRNINISKLEEDVEIKFTIEPGNARNLGFDLYDEDGFKYLEYSGSGSPVIYNDEVNIIEVGLYDNKDFINGGIITFKIRSKQYGFVQLNVITKDGKHSDLCDIYIADESIPKDEIQGVVFDFTKVHSNYKFGSSNEIELGFTYFPKTVLSDDEKLKESLKQNASNIDFGLKNGLIKDVTIDESVDGRGKLIIQINEKAEISTRGLIKNSSYSFNVFEGYNIHNENELKRYENITGNLYILRNIYLSNQIVFRNGVKLYGNNLQINHSNLALYEKDDEGKLPKIGAYAIEFNGNNSGLYDTHIIGRLDENFQPYENIINVGMIARSSKDRKMEMKNNIIENGRFNVSIKGFSDTNKRGIESATVFEIDNNQLIGSFLAALEVEANKIEFYDDYTVVANISKLKISYTAIGIVLQNAYGGDGLGQINLNEKDGVQAITSDSWRNLDDATGALSSNNFGYILKELKSDEFKDVQYREGRDYYVNPVIMIRGGRPNYNTVNFNCKDSTEQLIRKIRRPNLVEAMHPSIGGSSPFIIYLLDKDYYPKGDTK